MPREMSSPQLNLARNLSEYAASIDYDDIPENVIIEAKKRLIDGVGCAIGAFNEEPVSIARRVSEKMRMVNGGSTILGTRTRIPPHIASFVNGIMVRYFDYNDTYLSREPAHPSDNIGECLSVADFTKSSGKDLLLSLILAYEIQCRLCDAADIRHRGWDHVCYILVAGALAAGKLMKLTQDEMTQAVNLALNSHITMRQVRAGELSMWKGCSAANAERNAVFCAMLAKEGMTGPSPIFEGEMGFFKEVSGPFEMDTNVFGGKEGGGGSGFKIAETFLKFFPAEIHSQSAILAALEARAEIKSPEEDIASVDIASHEAGYSILGKDLEKWKPSTKETADHSLPYIVAMALLEGRITNSTYSKKKVTDPRVLEFLKKVIVHEDKALTAMYPEAAANRVTVTLNSGQVLSKQVAYHKGHPKNPMSQEEIETKFRRLTRRYISEKQSENLLGMLWKLEEVRDISRILPSFAIPVLQRKKVPSTQVVSN